MVVAKIGMVYNKPIFNYLGYCMNTGDTYESNKDGTMVVVEYNGALSVKVRFPLTGYTTTTRAGHVRSGSVRDRSLLPKAGDIFESNNCGKFIIMSYSGALDVVIKFVNTGTVLRTGSSKIKSGAIRDYFMPIIFGIGFFGDGIHKANVNGKDTKCYKAWYGMMTRCYSDAYHKARPTYIGCSVCEDWHDFQCFAVWYHENYPSDGGRYQLDKDIKIDGNKVYSPLSCMFVTLAENNVKAQAKHYRFKSPSGEIVKIYNMAEYCRLEGLNSVLMGRVNNGKAKSHKGWTRA